MRSLLTRLAIVTAGLFVCAPALNAEGDLALKVSPGVTTAPGHILVTATIGRHVDNRLLEIAAVSDDFYRSSQFQLEGDQAPRTTLLELKGLPGGRYDVVLVLHRVNRSPAVVRRSVLVTTSASDF